MVTGDPELSDDAFRAASIRLDELVREFESLPYPAIRDQIFEMLAAVDAVHRIGLQRIAAGLREWPSPRTPSPGARERGLLPRPDSGLDELAAADFAVKTLLTLYDLLPAEPGDSRGVTGADASALPGRPVPDNPPNFIPLTQIKRAPVFRRRIFQEVARLDEVPPGTTREVEFDGSRVLVANVDGAIYAVSNSCPGSMAPLSLGSFSPPVITCPWHNDAFDIRTGQRVDNSPGSPLTLLPVEIEGGSIKLRPASPNGGPPQVPELTR